MSTYEYDKHISGYPSRVIEHAYYDTERKTLFVQISGRIYGYYGVSNVMWDNFTQAESLGSFYSANIKGMYTSIADSNIVLTEREDADSNLRDFVVTLQGTWDVSVKARTLDDAILSVRKDAPSNVVVKEVTVKFE